jgi:ABC-type lipoprotein release transport system permease subunit
LLTAVGVYGSVAYVTAGRTREIAVRRALGARGAWIVALVVRESAAWTVAGLAAGLAGAFALSRYLETLLFGVGARDSITFLPVSVLLEDTKESQCRNGANAAETGAWRADAGFPGTATPG